MHDAGATTTDQRPARFRASPRFADPSLAAIAVYTALALATAVAAYLALFTQFALHDDEGTMLVGLQAFAEGETLYTDVYSPYGPFFYGLFGGALALLDLQVTTELSRSVVVLVWVATSFMYGLAAHLITGRLLLGATAMLAAFGCLYVLSGEPMHPHGLSVLLLAALTLVAVRGPGRVAWSAGAAAGVLVGALALTKINLGAFTVAAIALAAVLTVEPLYRRGWLRWPVIVAFLSLPPLVMARDLSTAWVNELMLVEVLSMAAIVVAAYRVRPRPGDDPTAVSRWLAAAALGFAAAVVVILAAILATGASPAGVYDGLFTEALRIRDVLVTPLTFPAATLDWALIALAAAVLSVVLRRGRGGTLPPLWSGILRALAGLAIWFAVARFAPFSLNPSPGNPDTLPMVLAWLAAAPPAGTREDVYRRFVRVLLPALAVAQTLQVYPVAGSQMGIAASSFVVVGAICLADAVTCLRAWSAERGPSRVGEVRAVVTVATVVLAAQFAVATVLRPAAAKLETHGDRQALPFDGAEAMRLPRPEAETYAQLVHLLQSHRCTAFIGYPNINSLYLWAGIEPPAPYAPGAWIQALEHDDQQRVVDELRRSRRPCAIRSQGRADLWLRGAPPPDLPLVRYVFDSFRPVATVGEFEFLLPRRGAGA